MSDEKKTDSRKESPGEWDDASLSDLKKKYGVDQREEPAPSHAAPAPEPVAMEPSAPARSQEKKENGFVRFLKALLPWKGDPVGEIIRKLVLLISVITLIVCGVYFANRAVQRHKAQQENDSLSDLIGDNSGMDPDEALAAIQRKYPDVEFPEGMQPKFFELYARNQDFVGWLEIPGTNISQPIMKAVDNDFYLRRDYNKQDTAYGNPFMDYRNNIRPFSRNTVIYGHYMRDNLIFARLKDYTKLGGFQNAPLIHFDTLFEDTRWKVYGVFITNAEPEQDNGYAFYYYNPTFSSDEVFMEFVDQINQRRLYDTGVDIKSTDKIMTLSTCYTTFKDDRLVVIARQVREGESTEVDVSRASVNANPRYPQAWYDKKGKENPFRDAEHWVAS